ncbi:MAG: hypothetical protein HXX15_06810 [Rhodopseudomonas sp.]|uniref:hypothetical protein n=1 Tax=Rhodopseudomonas sp. TaxID=1078 RepID=UPI00183D3E59|nr:hypothetical protein [Rhodopseudomonas sp.]NVN85785.1 hypothetical protein [Rhodopseudomonas sp.]
MRGLTMAIGLAFAIAAQLPMPADARPQTASAARAGASQPSVATDLSAQSRTRRPPRRLRVYPRDNGDDVYPRYFPGANAVRDCTATYVQEFRPSGTVITPRMNCFWRRG